MDFLLIALLILLNGVFAMSELALASSRRLRLEAMAQNGDKGAQAALRLLDEPTQFLSSVQVGITSIGMLNGILGEAAFSDALRLWLQTWGMPTAAASLVATAAVIVGITFSTIVLGELVPKRIGQLFPEQVARAVARPMTLLARITHPFVRLLSFSTQAVLTLLHINDSAERTVTQAEIMANLAEGRAAGVIEHQEHRMLQNVFSLDNRPLTALMVPRADVHWLDAELSVSEGLRLASSNGGLGAHSWYPVCQQSLDDVRGIISVAHLLTLGPDAPGQLHDYILPATFVPETLSGMDLLEQMRATTGRFIFVVDEYGVVQGIMTPRDLLQAITGELQRNSISQAWAVQRSDGSWLLDGQIPITELKSRLNIEGFPGEERGLYSTLSGLLLSVSGHLLSEGECIVSAGWVFEVVDMDGRRIDKVLAQAQK